MSSAQRPQSEAAVLRHTRVDSPVGILTLVGFRTPEPEGAELALEAVWFDSDRHRDEEHEIGERDDVLFELAREQLERYFSGQLHHFDLMLQPRGTEFEKQVWMLLREIPYGQTRSYGQLATQLGDAHLSRAVGAANGRNPLSIIVPCHRVVGADGSLTGYAGGLDRKRLLLDLERDNAPGAERLF